MIELLVTAKLIGVFLLFGGALFRRVIWSALSFDANHPLGRLVDRRSRQLTISGATIFVLAVFSSVATTGKQVGFLHVAPAALTPVLVAVLLLAEARGSAWLANLAAVLGLAIIGSISASSHAATEPGLLPVACNFMHWIAVLAWGGCLLQLALLPWPRIGRECDDGALNVTPLIRRHAQLTFAALALLLLSGGLLAFIHVHNADAMQTTHYGRFVIVKASLTATLFITVSINLLGRYRSPCRGFARVVVAEAVVLAGLLVASANLETRVPPGVPPFNNPQSWQMTADDLPLTIRLQPVGGSSTRVRIEISAARPDYSFGEETLALFDLYASQGEAGTRGAGAVWIGPSGFLGEAVVAIPGEWTFGLRLEYPDGTTRSGTATVALPALPLREDLHPFLSFSAIVYSLPGLVTFVVGALLLASSGRLLHQSWAAKAPPWLMPVSMASMVLGGYLGLSVAFVKTYPTTFWNNPQPYDAEVIRNGEAVYREHCAECHGIAGKGDGPWAIAERGSIPDLTGPHMDIHTDGEVFWWISKGIPSLDKPPLADELSETDRWTVINYTRSLRHGLPAR